MSNRLREVRESHGLTLAQLAKLAGTTAAQLSRMDTGERRLSDVWAEKISKALNVESWELFGSGLQQTKIPILGNANAGPAICADLAERQRSLDGDDQEWTDYVTYEESGNDLYSLKVEGESMNRLAPDGSFIICQDIRELGLPLERFHNKPVIAYDSFRQRYYFKIYDHNARLLKPDSWDRGAEITPFDNGFSIYAVVLAVRNRLADRIN